MNKKYYAATEHDIENIPDLPQHDEIRKNPGQPYYIVCRNGKLVARVWIKSNDNESR